MNGRPFSASCVFQSGTSGRGLWRSPPLDVLLSVVIFLSIAPPSSSAWAHASCVRCSVPAAGRVARCADEGGELARPKFPYQRLTLLETAGIRCGDARNSEDQSKLVEPFRNALREEARAGRELSTRSPALNCPLPPLTYVARRVYSRGQCSR